MRKYKKEIEISLDLNISIDKNILYVMHVDDSIKIDDLINYLNKLSGAHIMLYVKDSKFDFNKFVRSVDSEFFDVFNNIKEKKNFRVFIMINPQDRVRSQTDRDKASPSDKASIDLPVQSSSNHT